MGLVKVLMLRGMAFRLACFDVWRYSCSPRQTLTASCFRATARGCWAVCAVKVRCHLLRMHGAKECPPLGLGRLNAIPQLTYPAFASRVHELVFWAACLLI